MCESVHDARREPPATSMPAMPKGRGLGRRRERDGVKVTRQRVSGAPAVGEGAAALPVASGDGHLPPPPPPPPATPTAPPRVMATPPNGGSRRKSQSLTAPSAAPAESSSSGRSGTAATAVTAAPAAAAAAAADREAAVERRRRFRAGGGTGGAATADPAVPAWLPGRLARRGSAAPALPLPATATRPVGDDAAAGTPPAPAAARRCANRMPHTDVSGHLVSQPRTTPSRAADARRFPSPPGIAATALTLPTWPRSVEASASPPPPASSACTRTDESPAAVAMAPSSASQATSKTALACAAAVATTGRTCGGAEGGVPHPPLPV